MAADAVLGSELAQLVFVGIIVLVSLALGERIYRRANKLEDRVEDHITSRKRPEIAFVLYDIFWAPAILGGVLLSIRIALEMVPGSALTAGVSTILEYGLISAILWFALRVIRVIIQIDEDD